jgi:hypothetical protein
MHQLPKTTTSSIVACHVIVPAAATNDTGGFIGIIAAIVASIGAGYDDGATPYQ